MSTTHDELAGVVDLFGALTRTELAAALHELAFKQGQDVDRDAFQSEIEAAVKAYSLVEYEPVDAADDATDATDDATNGTDDATDETEPLVAVGPTAFPRLPANAEDLPHILDYDRRSVDRNRLAEQVSHRLTREAEAAADADDAERAAELLDVSYDVESWAAVDTGEVRSTVEPILPHN